MFGDNNVKEKKKRQPNAYMNFYAQHRADLKEKYPTLKMTEIAKKAGQMWSEMSEEEKAHFKSPATS